jgi:molybdopterin biosynthesis enzyme
VGQNEAVRIFIGGVIPDGADAIVFREEAGDTGSDLHFDASVFVTTILT